MCSSSHFPVSLPFCETCNSWTDWQLASCSVTTASDKVVSDENCQDCAGKYLLSFFCPLSIPPFLTHITCLNTTPYCTHAHMHSHTSIDYLMTKAAEERTFFPSLSLASWGGGGIWSQKKSKRRVLFSASQCYSSLSKHWPTNSLWCAMNINHRVLSGRYAI